MTWHVISSRRELIWVPDQNLYELPNLPNTRKIVWHNLRADPQKYELFGKNWTKMPKKAQFMVIPCHGNKLLQQLIWLVFREWNHSNPYLTISNCYLWSTKCFVVHSWAAKHQASGLTIINLFLWLAKCFVTHLWSAKRQVSSLTVKN